VKTGQQLKVICHPGPVELVFFSSDEETIITVYVMNSGENIGRVWKRFRQSDCIGVRLDTANELFVMKFCPKLCPNLQHKCLADANELYASKENPEEERQQESSILSFTQAINLDDASQKECSIQ
ncbi:hypothetical protein H0W26_03375, partial [Candidatus Dependentiae bacterium]|nr:hypothetical protein [Candidatus Dependentiae bacterium]